MKRYVFNKSLIFTGRVLTVTEFDPFPTFSTDISPPPLQAGEWAKWLGDKWTVVTEMPAKRARTMPTMSVKDFKLALLDAELLDKVSAHITALPAKAKKRVKIELENGGDITLRQAKKLLSGVVDDNVIKQLFIDGLSL